jgi:hypothetical protein
MNYYVVITFLHNAQWAVLNWLAYIPLFFYR